MSFHQTDILVIITILVSLFAWNNDGFYKTMIFNPYLVKHKGQYYRFLTSGFIHANLVHLGFNMLALFTFGRVMEAYFIGTLGAVGKHYFMFMYVAAIIVSDLPTYFKNKNNSYYNSLGASGGVAAVLFAYILVAPANNLYIIVFPVPAVVFGAIYLIYSYYMSKNSRDNIGHEAHFWGALFGLIFTGIIMPSSVLEFFHKLTEWNFFN